MRKMKRLLPLLAVIFAFALIAAACGGDGDDETDGTDAPGTTQAAGATEAPATTEPAMSSEPVAVCELAYFTGEFAAYGPSLTADVVFPNQS